MDIIAGIERDHPGLAHVMHLEPHTAPETPGTPPGTFAKTAWQAAHRDVSYALVALESTAKALGHVLPIAERIVTDPVLDRLIETALRAADLGVDAAVFEFVTDSLRAATAKVTAQPVTDAAPSAPDADSGLSVTTGTASAPEPKTDPPPGNENAIPDGTQQADGEAAEAQA